jgi:hypothetical protein
VQISVAFFFKAWDRSSPKRRETQMTTCTSPLTFHRNHIVSLNGETIGTWQAPDPSGAAWVRAPLWIFKGRDGRVEQSRSRNGLTSLVLMGVR